MLHIGDRKRDIYDLFCVAEEIGTHFLVRTCLERLTGTGKTTISKKVKKQSIQGHHEISIQDRHGEGSTVKLDLRFCRMTMHPPIGKQKHDPRQSLTVIYA